MKITQGLKTIALFVLATFLSCQSVFAYEYDYNIIVEQQINCFTYSLKNKAGLKIEKDEYKDLFKINFNNNDGKLSVCGKDNKQKQAALPSLSITSPNNVDLNNLTINQLYLKVQDLEAKSTSILKADTFQVEGLKAVVSTFADGNYLINQCLSIAKSAYSTGRNIITLGENTVFSCGDVKNYGNIFSEENISIVVQPHAKPTQLGSINTKKQLIFSGEPETFQEWFTHPDTTIKAGRLILPTDRGNEYQELSMLFLSATGKNSSKFKKFLPLFKNHKWKFLKRLKFDSKHNNYYTNTLEDNHLQQYTTLTDLSLSHCEVITDKSLFQLTNLESLSLENCTSVQGEHFQKLTKLKQLILSMSLSLIYPPKINKQAALVLPQGLTNLSMRGIKFQKETFNGLTKLEHLAIQSPKDTSLNFNFIGNILRSLSNLKTLTLRWCGIDQKTENKIREHIKENYPELTLTIPNL